MDKRALVAALGSGALVGWWATKRLRAQPLRGRVAVVTGATRGLGLRVAALLAEAGCPVAICARDEQQLAQAASALAGFGSPVVARRVDVADAGALTDFLDEVATHFGRIDILVNNAGIIQAGPLEEMALADFRYAMAIDFWGTVYGTLAVLPGMRRRGRGTIVNVTSIGGEIAVPHLLPYSCAKAAALAFSEGLTAELGGTGIRVVTVVPWLMRTGSTPYVYYKGRHDAERAMFGLGQLPIVSVNADRAARRIVRAIRRGETRVTIGLLAKLAREAHALAPGLLARVFAQARRLMPPPTGGVHPTIAVRGTTLDIR